MAGYHVRQAGDHHFKEEDAALAAHEEGLAHSYLMVFEVGGNADDGAASFAVGHHDGECLFFAFMAHFDRDDAGVQILCDFPDIRPGIDFFSCHGKDFVPRLYPLFFGGCAGKDGAYHGEVREGLVASVEEGADEDEEGQEHVGNGARCDDEESCPHGAVHEGPGVVGFIAAVHAGNAVEAAQGDGPQRIEGFPFLQAPQFGTEAYGEFIHPHAGEFGGNEVAAFVDEDNHRKDEDGSEDID